MRETGKETEMKDTTMKNTTRSTISRRELVTAAYIVPFAAVRGRAQNSAGTGGLLGRGALGPGRWHAPGKSFPGPRVVRPGGFFPEKDRGAKEAPRGAGRKGV